MSDRPSLDAPYLELEGICKRFGRVSAFRDVSMSAAPGEVVALVGDNGAGKSTLIKVISGFIKPDAGTIRVAGQEVRLSSPHVAAAHGVATVYQDLALCENLDVVANLSSGPRANGGPVRRATAPVVRARDGTHAPATPCRRWVSCSHRCGGRCPRSRAASVRLWPSAVPCCGGQSLCS